MFAPRYPVGKSVRESIAVLSGVVLYLIFGWAGVVVYLVVGNLFTYLLFRYVVSQVNAREQIFNPRRKY